MSFIRNAWYVACSAEELRLQPVLGRRICGERMVLHRNGEGRVSALEDWCPHRGTPLSMGSVQDGVLVCGYHGLRMGCDGKTLAMPGQRVRGFAPIRSFACEEHAGFIWVWPGEASLATRAALPELPWVQPGWTFGGGLFHIACDYRLMIDNLMDLTHETYVHADSIGQKEIDESPCETRVEGEQVTTRRLMQGVTAPPFWQMALRMNGLPDQEPVDRWQVCHFRPPSHVMIEVGVALAGQGGQQAPEHQKAASTVVDFITPETEHSIWYFWGMARRFRAEDAALTAQIREGQGRIFAQDQAMLEAQQANLAAQPQRKLLALNIDAGGVQARRIIERRIAVEALAAAPTSASAGALAEATEPGVPAKATEPGAPAKATEPGVPAEATEPSLPRQTRPVRAELVEAPTP
jgi:vanillate monooxygenase